MVSDDSPEVEKFLKFNVDDIYTILNDITEVIYHLVRPKIVDICKNIEKSAKKREIIELINEGILRQSEIAKKLHVDRTTVRDHIEGINRYSIKSLGIPVIRTTRKGLKTTFIFKYLIKELKETKEYSFSTLETLLINEEEKNE